MQWDLCLILSRCQTAAAFFAGWQEAGLSMALQLIRTFCACISTNTLPSVGYTTPKHHKVNAGKLTGNGENPNRLSWDFIKKKKKNNQNHRNQSTLLLESLFLKAVQDGLDPLDGHSASLSNDVLPVGLHRVQFQQLFCQKFLQVPVTLVRLFPYKLIHILLEELNSGQNLLNSSQAGIIA